jgi:hypothetical protein
LLSAVSSQQLAEEKKSRPQTAGGSNSIVVQGKAIRPKLSAGAALEHSPFSLKPLTSSLAQSEQYRAQLQRPVQDQRRELTAAVCT